jgi:hypothetical protein
MTERNPVRTKAITAAILNFLGDFFRQVQQLSLLLPLHFTSFFPMKLNFFFCVPLEISFFELQVFVNFQTIATIGWVHLFPRAPINCVVD